MVGKDVYGGFYSVLTRRDIADINSVLETTDFYGYLEPRFQKITTPRDISGLPKNVLLENLEVFERSNKIMLRKHSRETAEQFRGEKEYPYLMDSEGLGHFKRQGLIIRRAIDKLKADQRREGWPSYKGNPKWLELMEDPGTEI
jgi:hypothetical protein